MAGTNALDIDPATGLIRTGRFAGRSADEVMAYLEHLETAMESEGPPPPAEKPAEAPKPKTPAETLAERSSKRTTPFEDLALANAMRAEADDEAEFASQVVDYEKYREKITKGKTGLSPVQRTQRGLHKQMYLFLKQQEPEIQARLLGQEAPPNPEELPAEEEPVAEPEPETLPKPAAKPQEEFRPKPAPASARPSPAARSAPKESAKQPKLKATDKLTRIAAGMGKSVEAYLLELEARGVTQDTIDSNSSGTRPGSTGRRSSIYDRT